jgi:hypothetical protein
MCGWNMAKPVDPSVVGTSTDGYAVSYPFQRKSFYANGRFWVFYSDGTNMVYRTSTDGSTWSSATTVRAATAGYYFSVWFDGTYLHYAYASSSAIYYRRGTPNSDGTITWSAGEQTVSTTYNKAFLPTISVDSNRYVWVGYRDYSGTYYYPYVIKSGNNDGTWGTGTITQLSTTENVAWRVIVIPLTSGKMLAVYAYDGATVKVKKWDGSAWGTEVATTSAISSAYYFSAVAQGDDAHLTFLKSTYNIIYTKYTYSTNSFGTETTLVSGATSTSAPVLSIDTATNDLYVFAATKTTGTPPGWTADHIYYIKYTASSGTWGSWTDWIDESSTGTNELLYYAYKLICFYQSYGNYIGLEYMTKTASPYNVKFAYLSLVAAVTVTVTDSVGLSDAALCNKTFSVSDSASLSDAVLCHKTFVVSDSVGLTETLIGLPATSKIVADVIGLTDVVSVYVGAILKIVEDSVGLSDAVYRNKSLIISDTVSVLDQIFRHKPLVSISDALTLAEVVAVSKLFIIADSVSLSDVARVLKQLRVSDSVTLTDAAQVPSRILAVLDSIGLSDAAKVDKALIISDQIALVEVVYAFPPVKKTKLFLIVGNLAIQLTGD